MKSIAVLLMMLLLACSNQSTENRTVTIKGSDTMVRLGQRWAEEYMRLNPGSVIQVSGGGSGTGFAALLNGTTDICQASRDIKAEESKQAADKSIVPHRVPVALDGIAIFVHQSNQLPSISLEQLRLIYTGEITNWRDLGLADAEIIPYSRENNSGTYSFFKEHVLQGADFVDRAQTLPGTSAVVHAVGQDPAGLGYGGIAWSSGVRLLPVRNSDTASAIEPTTQNITSGSYPISRELYWFTNGVPTGEIKALLDYALSPAGQTLAEEIDYVPIAGKTTAAP